MSEQLVRSAQGAIPIQRVAASEAEAVIAALPGPQAAWARAHGFTGTLGRALALPSETGVARVLFGWGDSASRARSRLDLGGFAATAPAGVYTLEGWGAEAGEAALAWLMGRYRFDRYKIAARPDARLLAPEGVDVDRVELIAAGDALTRDLINTPAEDMGVDALEVAFRDLAGAFGAQARSIVGEELLAQNFPLIHAVGRASDKAPRLLDMVWGPQDGPKVTLVGKGVVFDTGGLGLKPSGAMGLMKKDMGGSATVLGLAHMIMAARLPVRLRVLVPAVENSVSAGAFRPGDVFRSRKGLTVEVNHTDAEGRLVLADALALADEETPDLILNMATLTGAARVALGPDLPPFYTDDATLASDLEAAAAAVADPLWRMPFWTPYEGVIEPGIADLDNAPAGGMGGSITAALFLRRFVENAASFAHFDIYGWTPSAKPARPKGGACQGARACFELLTRRYGD